MGHAGLGGVHAGTTETFGGDGFGRHGLHDARARDEHLARLFRHEDEVGNGGGVAGTAGAGSEDHGNLRDDARGERIAGKDAAIAVEGVHAFFDTGATAVVDADERGHGFEGEVHRLANFLGVGGTEGTAAHGEVLGGDIDGLSVDLAVTGDDAVTENSLGFGQIEASRDAEGADFAEGALVKKNFEAFAGGELALRVLLFDTGGPTAGNRLGFIFV